MNESPLLTFNNVTFKYQKDQQEVLRELNLEILPETATAILGPNGVGKTTLLHIALGYYAPQAGEVKLMGTPLEQYSRQEMGRLIGLVPQFEITRFEYSMLEYVALGRAPYLKTLEMPGAEDIEIAYQALEKVGLQTYANRTMTALSGGERQLVLVARALAQRPRLLLLDEATSHLDLKNKLRLATILGELLTQGITIVFTTHEPEVAAALATHLVLMKDGKVLEKGLFEEKFTSENLSAAYDVPVSVHTLQGRKIALWGN